jgi:serine/threonine protein kinase
MAEGHQEDYSIGKYLAEGFFGYVNEAIEVAGGRTVVIKRPQMKKMFPQVVADTFRKERYILEVRKARRLTIL